MPNQKQFLIYMPNLDSSKLAELLQLIKARGIDFVSEIRASPMPPVDFIVSIPRDRVAEKAGKGFVSRRQLKLIQASAKRDLGLHIEWFVSPSKQAGAVEAALNELLAKRWPNHISNVYLSSLNVPPVSAWIERTTKPLLPSEWENIRNATQHLLRLYDVEKSIVLDADSPGMPSIPMILRKLKVSSPVTIERLAEYLSPPNSSLCNIHWLQSRLDRLRKQGLLTRSKIGEYCLTESGLAAVPHSRSRSSSDIERALALGRRKW